MSLQSLGQADGITSQCDRQHAHNAVVAQPTKVEDLVLPVVRLVSVLLPVAVPQAAVFQLLNLHPARVQRPQLRDSTGGTAADLGVGVAVEQAVSREHLPKLKARLPAVGLLVQDAVQRQITGAILAALGQTPVQVQRHRGKVLRDQPNAGQHRRALQGRLGRDSHASRATGRRLAPAVPVRAPQVDDAVALLFGGLNVSDHMVTMSQFCSGFGEVAVCQSPTASTRATMPSMRSVLLSLLGLMSPA